MDWREAIDLYARYYAMHHSNVPEETTIEHVTVKLTSALQDMPSIKQKLIEEISPDDIHRALREYKDKNRRFVPDIATLYKPDSVTDWLRKCIVFARCNYTCTYCCKGIDELIDASGRHVQLHLDHKIPKIRGGSEELDNLTAACQPDNMAKKEMTEPEYRAWIKHACG